MESQEMKIRKGQAFNLAVNDAVHNNEHNNAKYIYERFVWYYNLADIVQGSDIDMIQEVLNKPDFDKAVAQFKKLMEK